MSALRPRSRPELLRRKADLKIAAKLAKAALSHQLRAAPRPREEAWRAKVAKQCNYKNIGRPRLFAFDSGYAVPSGKPRDAFRRPFFVRMR
jgi:hypothetical protein